jgi:dUTP pyrophosphatase
MTQSMDFTNMKFGNNPFGEKHHIERHEVKFTLAKYAQAPSKSHDSDAGFDLRACHSAIVRAGSKNRICTGVSVSIPKGMVGLVWPRSGLALSSPWVTIDVLAGVIDSGYTGMIEVGLINHGPRKHEIEIGDKIAQLVIQPISMVDMKLVTTLDDTERGAGGFGSTGR